MYGIKPLFLCLLTCFSFSLGRVKFLKREEWVSVKKIVKPSSVVIFIVHKNTGQQLILKQLSGGAKRYVNNLAMDALGALVAKSVGIPCNSIDIMPCNYSFLFKAYPKQPASLHSVIDGSTLKGVDWYDDLTIRQRKKACKPGSDEGLHLLAIKTMPAHGDLPPITALDTFLGNNDRHRNNMLYNKQNGRLYAIDFTLAFSRNLAHITLKNLQALKQQGVVFTAPQLHALKVYTATLKKLLAKHTPSSLCAMIDKFVRQTGFPNHRLMTYEEHKKIIENIDFRKKMVYQNYESTKALVAFLTKMLQ